MHNDVMHAVARALGSTRRLSTRAVHIANSALARCQLYSCKSANSQLSSSTSNERTPTLPDKRACNVYDDVIRCEVPLPNLNFAIIFYAWFGAKPPNLKTANISSYMVYRCVDEFTTPPLVCSGITLKPMLLSAESHCRVIPVSWVLNKCISITVNRKAFVFKRKVYLRCEICVLQVMNTVEP